MSIKVLIVVSAFGPKWLKVESEAARRVVEMHFQWLAAVWYLFHSRDKAFSLKQVKDAVKTNLKDPELKTKTIVFIRHGESCWNEMFNRGFGPGFPFRVLKGLLLELHKLTLGDSLFLDSPLNVRGEKEDLDICRYLRSQSTEERTTRTSISRTAWSEQARRLRLCPLFRRSAATLTPSLSAQAAACRPIWAGTCRSWTPKRSSTPRETRGTRSPL